MMFCWYGLSPCIFGVCSWGVDELFNVGVSKCNVGEYIIGVCSCEVGVFSAGVCGAVGAGVVSHQGADADIYLIKDK